MPVRQWIDQLLPNFVAIGRGANTLAFKSLSTGVLELRNAADSAYRDLRIANLQLDGYSPNSRLILPRRQCVLAGPINTTTGQPNLLSSSGLSVVLNVSTSNPVVVAFAAGFDGVGAIDYVGHFTGQLIASIPANSTRYFYLDRTVSGNTVSYSLGSTDRIPVYNAIAFSSAPPAGTHWFNTNSTLSTGTPGYTMNEWTGGAFVSRQRVFVGEATSGASSVATLISYAYQRRYQSPWLSASTSSNSPLSFTHNLGMTLAAAAASVYFAGRTGAGADEVAVPSIFFDGSGYYGAHPAIINANTSRLIQDWYFGNSGVFCDSAWRSAGQFQLAITSGW